MPIIADEKAPYKAIMAIPNQNRAQECKVALDVKTHSHQSKKDANES
jgi:hypothetical protein